MDLLRKTMPNIFFEQLEKICERPAPFEYYTAEYLWTNEHTLRQMLKYHLDESVDISSRRGAFIDKSVEWIVSRFNVDSATKIADMGCGPGLYALRLAQRHADVTGIDFSPNSIEYARNAARAESLSIDYCCANYLEYVTDKRFDLIMMIMCDFCALSPMQRRHLLKKFCTMLRPGGSLLFDVYTMNAFDGRKETSTFEVNKI